MGNLPEIPRQHIASRDLEMAVYAQISIGSALFLARTFLFRFFILIITLWLRSLGSTGRTFSWSPFLDGSALLRIVTVVVGGIASAAAVATNPEKSAIYTLHAWCVEADQCG